MNCIIQDRQGFMWFATSEGLNRFDGYEFTIYRHVDGDTSSIPSDNISELYLDKEGQIWMGSANGLAKYNRNLNTFTSFAPDTNNEASISSSQVNRMIEDPSGNFWIAFLNGVVDYFDRKKNTFAHFQISSDLPGKGTYGEATSLLLDKNGNLWIGTFHGITVLNAQREEVQKLVHDPQNAHSLSSDRVHDIIQDRNEVIWVATENGLNRYDHRTGRFVRFIHDDKNENSLSTNVVRRMLEDKEGRIWIGTENGGLDILDHQSNRFYHFMENKARKTGISDNSIYSIYRDRLDNMWVGTNAQGVNFYDRYARPFTIYQSSPGVKGQLNYDKVNGVDEQPGKGFWISTEGGGLNLLNAESDLFIAYQHDKNDPFSIPGDFAGDVVWDSVRHCVWVTTWGGGLWRMDPETGRGRTYKSNAKDSTTLAGNFLWRLYLNKGVLYIGTIGGGFSIYNDETDSFSNYSVEDGLAEKNVVSFYADKLGFLWAGGWDHGVSKMNLSQRKFATTPTFENMTSTFSTLGDSLGRLWFTTNDGILIYDEVKDSMATFTIKDGLPGRSVLGMLDDRKGNYWLSTNAGLVKFNVAKREFRTFTMADGLPTNQFSSWPFRAKDGRMFFGSAKGLVVFHPDSIKINPIVPKVYITDLRIFNESVPIGGEGNILTKPISETTSITLPYDHNVFSLTFVALSYTSSSRNQYAYQLEGFDRGWTRAQSNRMATYTSLDPGTYSFKVKASNNDGLWNDEGAILIIHVLPPWWQTWWFRFILGVISILVVTLITFVRTRNIKRSNRVLEETVRQKTKELTQTNQEILAQKEEIAQKNRMLVEQADELAIQNEQLIQTQEEVSSQRDLLSHQNENLEQEVEKRTSELIEHTKQLEQFAFISAHNLRAPVARILGLGQLLDMCAGDPDGNNDIYPKLIQTTKELDNVVRDLNAILDLKQSTESLITTIELQTEIESVMKTLEKEISTSHANILVDFSSADKIRTVKAYLDSILYNLISNAIKYRHPSREPVIKVKTERLDEEICLILEDNGLGIDLVQYRGKLFNLYSRLHFHVEGKGMGLYLVKTQMVSLGGRIEVTSEVNVGTVFKLYFKL
ncbi:MAG TPA: two-component regulator propeller domain-containing protein [Chryseolinea sp.]|nr:two-component regulator propeller domain-containing protein [Chryseolinea sp.]